MILQRQIDSHIAEDPRLPKSKSRFLSGLASIIKEVLGAMVYRRANKKAKAAALDNGLLLIQSVGKKKLHQITSAT